MTGAKGQSPPGSRTARGTPLPDARIGRVFIPGTSAKTTAISDISLDISPRTTPNLAENLLPAPSHHGRPLQSRNLGINMALKYPTIAWYNLYLERIDVTQFDDGRKADAPPDGSPPAQAIWYARKGACQGVLGHIPRPSKAGWRAPVKKVKVDWRRSAVVVRSGLAVD